MGLVACPDCGRQVSDVASACPQCGRPRAVRAGTPHEQQPKRKRIGCASVWVVGALIVFGAIGLVMGVPTTRPPAKVVPRPPTPESAAQKAQREAVRAAALANLPAQLLPLRAALQAALERAAKARNDTAEIEALGDKLDEIHGKAEQLERGVGKGASPELGVFVGDVDAALQLARAVNVARAHQALTGPREALKMVRGLIGIEDWRGAVTLCDGALSALASAQASREQAPWAARFLPAQRVTDATTKELQRLRERAVAGQQALRALMDQCGAAPKVSQWDGELVGLEAHIEETANDPDSIDVENCTEPRLHKKLCWVSECSVRGKNAFGALILRRMQFAYARGSFVDLD